MEAKTKSYKPTGRPAGWHWMAEFVDKDGNVFHKGKEQPKLKGTLPPTKVKPPKKKTKRRTKDEILVAKYNEKKEILKRNYRNKKIFLITTYRGYMSKKKSNHKLQNFHIERWN